MTYDVKTELVKFCFCFGGAGAARRDRKNDPTLTPECYTWVLFVGIRGHPGYIPGYHRWMWIIPGWKTETGVSSAVDSLQRGPPTVKMIRHYTSSK